MDPAHAEAIGAHRGGNGEQCGGVGVGGGAGQGFEFGDDRGEAGKLVGVVGVEAVGEIGQRGRVGEVGGEVFGHGAGVAGGELVRQRRGGGGELRGVDFEPLRLFGEAVAQAGVPADVGAAVHVVADPGGEAQRQRAQRLPFIGPALAGDAEQQRVDAVARGLAPGDGCHRLVVLEVERDRVALVAGDADRGLAGVATGGGGGDRFALRVAEQEGGVGGEDDVRGRAGPARGEGVEIGGFGLGAQPGEVFLGRDRGDQPQQPAGAGLEAVAFEFGDEVGQCVERELAALDPPRQFEAELEHRVEQRGFGGAGVERLEAGVEGGQFGAVGFAHRGGLLNWLRWWC